jgi:N-acetylmuramoyl-L-alanine amidase
MTGSPHRLHLGVVLLGVILVAAGCAGPPHRATARAGESSAAPAGRARRPPVHQRQLPVVCLDPGHPSEVSSGRTVQNGIAEVDANWAVASELGALLRQADVQVVFTKSRADQFVTNRQRAQIANRASSSLMLRLHCDTGGGSGITFYYPEREGSSGGMRGPSQEVRRQSRVAAQALHAAAVTRLGTALADNGIKPDHETKIGSKQGALTGSIYSTVPVVLVEMVFLSNKHDAEFVSSHEGQQALARALAAGVIQYLSHSNGDRAAATSGPRPSHVTPSGSRTKSWCRCGPATRSPSCALLQTGRSVTPRWWSLTTGGSDMPTPSVSPSRPLLWPDPATAYERAPWPTTGA